MARKYELKQRAEQVEETRRRILDATVELHRTVGPAATQVTEIARKAGVQRRTVYNHFPDEASLLAACSAHWRSAHPAPDPAGWRDLRHGLRELYAWFRETAPMTANVLRDSELLPALREIVEPGLGGYLGAVRGVLARGLPKTKRVEVAVALATDFHTWRRLAPLGDAEAAELSASLVEAAARSRRRSPARPGR